jgi:hypothetical protein
MEFLTNLWLPILLSTVFVFIVSSFLHMVLPHHKKDHLKIPGEENVLAALRAQEVPPGDYYFPRAASLKDAYSPDMIEKFKQGPVGFLTVVPSGPPNMTKPLILWFIFSLIISIFTAYIANLGLGPGAEYRAVFRLTGTVAVLGYAVTYIPDSIWKGHSWGATFRHIVDGVIYGLVTAGTFGWLWPDLG